MTTSDFQEIAREGAERILRNSIKIKELQAENDELKQFFKNEEYFALGDYDFGSVKVRVSRTVRPDLTLAARKLESSRYRAILKSVIDTNRAKRLLSDAEYEAILRKYDNKIEIFIDED